MSKLVQKVKWDLGRPHAEITEMYMYGEADLEANKAMQEPLEKLYQYENQPDMREKVKEYIGELEIEIDRCEQCIIDNGIETETTNNMLLTRCETLHEIIGDLKGRLEERI